MLYDVLPPLVFFGSLGGIILVVSRVMVRLRREQYANNVQAAVNQVSNKRLSKMEDLARVVGPSKKGVHVIKNRLTLVKSTATAAATNIKSSLAKRNPRRAISDRLKSLQAARLSRKKEKEDALAASTIKELKHTKPTAKPVLTMQEKPPAPAASKPKLFKKTKKLPALTRATNAIASAQHDQAENILVPYIAQHPKNTQAYMLLGQVSLVRHDWDEALEIYEQVIQLDPTTKKAYASLGQAAFEAGKFTRAIEALRRAHDADPQDATVIHRLLKIAQRMDNTPMQRSLMEELKILTKATKKDAKRQAARAQ